jgi:hypothetical protein
VSTPLDGVEALAKELDALRVRVEATEAVLAIHDLKARYGDLIDRRFARGAMRDDATVAALAEEIADTFVADGVWDGGKALGVARGRAQIVERMRTSTLVFSRHFFVKPQITVHGDRAVGRWDILSPCTTPDGTAHWMCGWEDDTYVRDGAGVWRHESMRLTTVFVAPATEGWSRIFA